MKRQFNGDPFSLDWYVSWNTWGLGMIVRNVAYDWHFVIITIWLGPLSLGVRYFPGRTKLEAKCLGEQ